MQKFKTTIVRAFEEHPVEMSMAGVALLYATSRFIQAVADSRGSKAYARQVDYRIRNKK